MQVVGHLQLRLFREGYIKMTELFNADPFLRGSCLPEIWFDKTENQMVGEFS